MLHGRFVRLIDRAFSRLAAGYGRRLERSLDYRPVTALFAAAVLASIAFMYMNTKAELAPEEDQGVLFALTKAPQYANLDYAQAYEGELDRGFTSFPETYLRFIVNGRFGPNQGIAGVILKPWDERDPLGAATEAAAAAKGGRRRGAARLRLLAAAAAGDDRRPADPDGDLLAGRLPGDLRGDGEDQGGGAQERHVHRRRQRPRLSTSRSSRSTSTARRPTSSGSRCGRSATPWRCWSARTMSTGSTSAAAPTK